MTARRVRRQYNARRFKQHVLLFVGVTAAVFALVVYFSFARTVITVTHAAQRLERTAMIAVGPAGTDGALSGSVRTATVQATYTENVPPSGEERAASAGGTVRIVNNAARNQPLVAGTRLLSENGVLFRTTRSVVAPRGGGVDVEVRADASGTDGEIGPSRFEIVALWASLKPLIYGESNEAFTGGTVRSAVVTEATTVSARAGAIAAATDRARSDVQASLLQEDSSAGTSVLAVRIAPRTERWSAQVGEEAQELTVTMTAEATSVVGGTDAFGDALTKALAAGLPEHLRLLDRIGAPDVTVQDADIERQSATLTAKQTVRAVLDQNDALLSPRQFVNKSRGEILSSFRQFESVRAVDVRFSPFWVLRAPGLADHIKVVLLEPSE